MRANDGVEGKLKFLTWVLQFSHTLFSSSDFEDAAVRVTNDTHPVLQFTTASLVEILNGRARVISQFGQPEKNAHSHLADLHCTFAVSRSWEKESGALELSAENGLPAELADQGRHYLCVPLKPSGSWMKADYFFLLLLEYPGPVDERYRLSCNVLAISIAEALYSHRNAGEKHWKFPGKFRKRLIRLILFFLLMLVMLIPVPNSASAEFSIRPLETKAVYAWFDGAIAECLHQDGDPVRKNEVIARYDVSQLQYRLQTAESQIRELSAELDLEQQNAFADESRLGKVRLLKAHLETLRVAEAEARWALDHAALNAPSDGILALTEGRAEKLIGKAVRTGDKIFEVMHLHGKTAEIAVPEKDAFLLNNLKQITLFLYSMPEKEIPAKVLEISKYPVLTEQKTFCYRVRVEIPDAPDYRFGMRGVAKLTGGRVLLVYRLFKDIVLYFRWL